MDWLQVNCLSAPWFPLDWIWFLPQQEIQCLENFMAGKCVMQVHGHDFSCITTMKLSSSNKILYASGSEEKVIRILEAPEAYLDSLAFLRGESSFLKTNTQVSTSFWLLDWLNFYFLNESLNKPSFYQISSKMWTVLPNLVLLTGCLVQICGPEVFPLILDSIMDFLTDSCPKEWYPKISCAARHNLTPSHLFGPPKAEIFFASMEKTFLHGQWECWTEII